MEPTEQQQAHQHQEQQEQQDQQQELPSPTSDQKRQRRKRSRWGAETEAGLKVLAGAEVDAQQGPQHPPAEQQQQQQSLAAADGAGDAGAEPEGRKKRRSRWEPESQAQPALLQGLQIALPPSIAALVDAHVDPRVMELQRQLNIVSAAVHACSAGVAGLLLIWDLCVQLHAVVAWCGCVVTRLLQQLSTAAVNVSHHASAPMLS